MLNLADLSELGAFYTAPQPPYWCINFISTAISELIEVVDQAQAETYAYEDIEAIDENATWYEGPTIWSERRELAVFYTIFSY